MPLALLLSLLACDPEPPAPIRAAPDSLAPAASVADQVQVSSPYARAMPAGSPTSAAFLLLRNQGSADTALVSARSTAAETVELHSHTMVEGLMQMRQVPRVDLPAGEQVALQPGGLHIMLIGLQRELKVGSELDLVLVFEDGSETRLQVPVREIMPGMGGGLGHDASPRPPAAGG